MQRYLGRFEQVGKLTLDNWRRKDNNEAGKTRSSYIISGLQTDKFSNLGEKLSSARFGYKESLN